ncbi:MAG TPA: hypothetical protein VNS88_17090 [Nitrospiraceae bacterium]|nr:hypothetical protein [Nitrospiraceae bacterium]
MPRISGPKYFDQLISDPVAIILFSDKILIVRRDGTSLERELVNGDEDYDDMPEGHG